MGLAWHYTVFCCCVSSPSLVQTHANNGCIATKEGCNDQCQPTRQPLDERVALSMFAECASGVAAVALRGACSSSIAGHIFVSNRLRFVFNLHAFVPSCTVWT